MLRPFKESNLFRIAMTKVLLSDYIPKDNFYVSIYEQELIDEANKLGVNVFKRSHESANNDNDLKKYTSGTTNCPSNMLSKSMVALPF